MLGKFQAGWGFLGPLSAHCAVHAAMTFVIAALFCIGHRHGNSILPFQLAAIDFTIHFMMDRIKAGPKYLGRFKALSGNEMVNILSYVPTLGEDGVKEKFGSKLRSNTLFWWSLGLDQTIHHLTHYYLIYKLVT
jgi:hypothetical protein